MSERDFPRNQIVKNKEIPSSTLEHIMNSEVDLVTWFFEVRITDPLFSRVSSDFLKTSKLKKFLKAQKSVISNSS